MEVWPWNSSIVLIGGYAVAAYGGVRYSDDIDFAVTRGGVKPLRQWLEASGFRHVRRPGLKVGPRFPDALRMQRGPVTVDLLIDYVRDREAQVDVPADWIIRENRMRQLDLLTGRVGTPVRVARPEAIWALKLQAGRDQDLTDLFAISTEPVIPSEVLLLFTSLMSTGLREKLRKVKSKVREPKIYNDSRSRLGLEENDAARARWRRFIRLLSEMIPPD